MEKIILYLSIVMFSFGYSSRVYSNPQLKTKKMILAKELCKTGTLSSFCSDGIGQTYRVSSVLVSLNLKSFIKSYDDTIYMILPVQEDSIFKEKRFQYPMPWELEKKFQDLENSNVKAVKTPSKYRRRINRYQKKIGSKKRFNGFFYYELFEMEFDFIYGGEIYIFLPDLLEGGFARRKVNVNYIVNIKNVAPQRVKAF